MFYRKMKTVYLIRHAKSDWNSSYLTDFRRTLNNRGKKDAPLMGKKLNSLNAFPELVLSSPAERAKQTITAICKEINYPEENIYFNESIYHSSTEDLIQLLNQLDDELEIIFLVGHNPGFTYLSNYLTDDYIDNIVTCGIVKIELEINSWNELIKGIGRKIFYIYPKMYY